MGMVARLQVRVFLGCRLCTVVAAVAVAAAAVADV